MQLTSTVHTIVTVRSSSTPSDVSPMAPVGTRILSSGAESPGSTGSPESEHESLTSDPTNSSLASAQQHKATESGPKEAIPTSASALRETNSARPTTSDGEEQTESRVGPAAITELQGTAASSVGVIGGLVSAIRSFVVQQGETRKTLQARRTACGLLELDQRQSNALQDPQNRLSSLSLALPLIRKLPIQVAKLSRGVTASFLLCHLDQNQRS